MQRTLMLIDTNNIYFNVMKKFPKCKISYDKVYKYFENFGTDFVVKAYLLRQADTNIDKFIDRLGDLGYIIDVKDKPWSHLCGITVDLLDNVHKFDRFILGTNNISLMPAIDTLLACDKTVIIFGANLPKEFTTAPFKGIEINRTFLENYDATNRRSKV